MRLFDLISIALFLGGVVALMVVARAVLRGRLAAAGRVLGRLGLAAAGYLAIVAAVSLVSPRRWIALGERQCSDDWCIAVTDAQRESDAAGSGYVVTFEVSSRARRVAQRERDVVAWLRDGSGRRFDAEPPGDEPAFDVRLRPGEVVRTRRTYRIPGDLDDPGMVIEREGGLPMPRCCIIGDEGSLFHKRTVVRLGQSPG